MTHSKDNTEPLCFTDFALQEYIMGRLADDARREIQDHLERCAECAAYTTLLKQESDTLRMMFASVDKTAAANSGTDETLALYLDGALDTESAQALEEALAGSSEQLTRLVNLFRRVSEVQQDLSGPAMAMDSNPVPEGLVLQMPKRKFTPRTVSDLDSGGVEESA